MRAAYLTLFCVFAWLNYASEVPILDVAVLEKKSSVYLSSQHGFQIFNFPERKKLFTRWNGKSLNFKVTERGFGFLHFNNLQAVTIEPFKKGLVYINGKGYRGKLKLFEDRFGKLTVVNLIDIESYLYGVIKSEMLINSPIEALKAQAVVARTYAIRNKDKFRKEGFGLTDDVRSQVYNGIEDEHPIARKVVKDTHGKILIYENEPISGFYHSACGGSTLASKDWHGKGVPYLKSKECKWCSGYKNYVWDYELSFAGLSGYLNQKGKKIRKIKKVNFEHDKNGRVKLVHISHQDGKLKISGTAFRQMISASKVRSTIFKSIDILKNDSSKSNSEEEIAVMQILMNYNRRFSKLKLRGTGFGHGVGLCQWGAKGLAKQKLKYPDILKYYFTGVNLNKIY
ncbi:MAG: SpoIID/LytB domain-containing protein [bacterium]|nr:SpoIID/LytB domain-containing protein [bacterium]